MSAVDLTQYLTQALYVIVFALALPRAIRHPRPATIETALLFGVVAVSVTQTVILQGLGIRLSFVAATVDGALVLFVPYLLLRLVDEFAGVPFAVQRFAEFALAASIGILFAVPLPRPMWATELVVASFGLVTLYVSLSFVGAARGELRVTGRRMRIIAAGSACLTVAILIAGLRPAFPSLAVPFTVLSGPFGLVSGLCFYIGFTTPRWLRRSWYSPDLSTFTSRADALASQTDPAGLLRELQTAATDAVGVPGTFVGLWNEVDQVLEYATAQVTPEQMRAIDPRLVVENGLLRTPADLLVAGQCFASGRPLYSEKIQTLDPEHATLYRALGVEAVIVAPMIAGRDRYGVLGAYTRHAQLFGEDALDRVQVIARQAAIMLRSRELLQRSASVQAEEELVQAKEDFLSAATHDLKTPLTAINGIAQLGSRQARATKPASPAELGEHFDQIYAASLRMRDLIDEVLDVSRLRMKRPLELSKAGLDLVELTRSVAARQQGMTSLHRIRVDASTPVKGMWDGARLERAIDNLIGNAVKFSPAGGDITVSIQLGSDGQAVMTIRDEGIGISPADLERIFVRFERGTNASRRGISGTGIGLAYVQEVIAAHGGKVTVDSRADVGSTFSICLPTEVAEPAAPAPPGSAVTA